MSFRIRFLLILTILYCGTLNICPGQSYGLGFESFEVVQDNRTGLDLSPQKTFCFRNNFEISFELAFLPDKKNYFGYVVRLIENDQKNIDILYDNSSPNGDHFKVVAGDKFSKIAFDIPEQELFKKWNKIRLLFDKQKGTITVYSGSKSYVQSQDLKADGCFKILFGTNKYKNFNTTDVPPMKIRNVSILEGGNLIHYWPLNDISGTKAAEDVKQRDGLVTNPLWIKKMHLDWQPLKTFVINGSARITCDQTAGIVHIIGPDSLTSFRVATNQVNSVLYKSQPQSIYMDNQVLYEKSLSKIFNLFVNEKQVSTFDLNSGKWDKNNVPPSSKTHFLHANKFYSAADSSIYVLGGYGHLAYKGNIQKYSTVSKTWTNISRKDSVFIPRYLAALGPVSGGAYVLGGYGSTTGQQILNPKNWYDLLFFNIKTGTFTKIYDLKIPQEDFVFANSMIINEKEKTFFALIFPKDKFNSELQLIQGSLTTPEYKIVGSKIPYQFIDTESFADLFYDRSTARFVAVTSFKTDKNQTKVAIYSLYAPPLEATPTIVAAKNDTEKVIWIVGTLAFLFAGFYILKRSIFVKKQLVSEDHKTSVTPDFIKEPMPVHSDSSDHHEKNSDHRVVPLHDSIMLFGNLQLFDEHGNEITKSFTPLLKELFLVILLYSIRREGISSEKLKELLWFDKPSESARNNRSVNIAKLKGILDKLKYCQVSKETGYWKINIDYQHIRVDYADYLNLVSDKRKLTKQDITELSDITKRGSFLSDLEYEWLDSFKSEVSNEIVDTYLRYANSVKITDDPEFLIKLANYIFYFDPVNEEAMTIKCKALAHLGKHSLAKTTLENFAREYNRIYGEEFRKDMPEVLHS